MRKCNCEPIFRVCTHSDITQELVLGPMRSDIFSNNTE